jgi:NAD(P)-dependent dehydrogenase (short-subunit alcohol dehydrogenase family)
MRVVAITGAASGIGAATRRILEDGGCRVIGVDLRDAEVQADLSHEAGRRKAIVEVTAACDGALDGLVCAAGISGSGPAGEDRVIAVNYFGTAELLNGLRPALERGERPAALAISSWALFRPWPLAEAVYACLAMDEPLAQRLVATDRRLPEIRAAYATSKLAVAKLVRRLAPSPEWAGRGITLNAQVPSTTETPMVAERLSTEAGRELMRRATPSPLGRFATAEDQGEVAAFLVSGRARYVSGQVLIVDGGLDARRRPDEPIQALAADGWLDER